MFAILLKKITDSPTMTVITTLGVSTVVILSAIHLIYEIKVKRIELKNLENK